MADTGMPFSDLMDIEILQRDRVGVVGRLTVREALCTTNGILHGGAIMAFADTLGAIGASLNLAPGAGTTTLESKTNFIAAARLGETVTGETTPLHVGRRSSVWQTRITNDSGRLVAIVTQTQMTLTP